MSNTDSQVERGKAKQSLDNARRATVCVESRPVDDCGIFGVPLVTNTIAARSNGTDTDTFMALKRNASGTTPTMQKFSPF